MTDDLIKAWVGIVKNEKMPKSSRDRHPTEEIYNDLEKLYQEGLATLPVNRINHREFVYDGNRYFCGWNSDSKNGWIGWIVYKVEKESQNDYE